MIYVLFIIIIIISSSCNSIIDIIQKKLTNLHTKFPASLLTASNLRALYMYLSVYVLLRYRSKSDCNYRKLQLLDFID